MRIKKVHVIFKTHLDMGYTALAEEVLKKYFNDYIPLAITNAQRLRQIAPEDRYIWTSGSWLLYEYLERASKPNRKHLENAIINGDITWHALPFTLHSEFLDQSLFNFGLSYSQRLDKRFGRKTITAKMTDVPGHTLGIVPLLAQAGVKFLHIGVNEVSCPPQVPPIFRWQHQNNSEVIVMYHKYYGDLMVVPGMDEAIYFAMTLDNIGPHGVQETRDILSKIRQQFPGAEVAASTMDAFAGKLLKAQLNLPVIKKEIGDTWIHGVGTDPKLSSCFKSLLRYRARMIAANPKQNGQLDEFSRTLMLIPEHTFGMDEKTFLNDNQNYSNKQLRRARKTKKYRLFEKSWQQKRMQIQKAAACLKDPSLAAGCKRAIADTVPKYPKTSTLAALPQHSAVIKIGRFEIKFQNKPAAICRLTDTVTGRNWASRTNPFAMFWYETFSQSDYDRFLDQYLTTKNKTTFWAVGDFSKVGIAPIARQHRYFYPQIKKVFIQNTPRQDKVIVQMQMPKASFQLYGSPAECFLEISASQEQPWLDMTFQWFNKTACRLPEALWLSFKPLFSESHAWALTKLGTAISPLNVVENGNRHLHCVENVIYDAKDGFLKIENLDSPLIAPGKPSLLNFTNEQPDLRSGVHFNLFNNVWGTNFRMWYDDDIKSRFRLQFHKNPRNGMYK